MVAFPERLGRLAQLTGEALDGPPAAPGAIDEPLVKLARRHQVGSLLYAVAGGNRYSIEPRLVAELEQMYRASAARRISALARLHQIADVFDARNIAWMTLKGPIQAQRLYKDPVWRFSSDLDLLVPPSEFGRALEALMQLGFIPSNPPIANAGILRGPILKAIRDMSLIADDDHTCAVELHRRLFVPTGRRANSIRLEAAPGDIPAPAIGPEMAFYMIAHGALSFWVRLKWLIDLVPLFAKLNDEQKGGLLECAQRVKAENSLGASLSLLRGLFPSVDFGPLAPWLERKEAQSSVRHRLEKYIEMIGSEQDWRQSPLDNRRKAVESTWLMFEAPTTRAHFLAFAPLSSVARKLAGALSREERALTQCDTQPSA